MNQSKVLLVELNEVPYRVFDAYVRERPDSFLSDLLSKSRQYTTVTEDRIALDPWISWPTLHRGVTDETHRILHLGQVLDDVDRDLPPLWRLLKERGMKVGVFGSLHSSSIPADISEYSFYLPDYFDDKVVAHPQPLHDFQDLNISMTRQSARNVSRSLPLASLARFLAHAPGSGLTLTTAADASAHLVREMFDRSLRIRRRAYQPLVMADLFLHQMRRTLPDFATFYTNHVAAAMHRYWGAAFPEDCEKPLDREWIEKYAGEIRFAMDKFDTILGRLLAFVDSQPEYTLIVASSMGQAAIPAQKSFEFLTITNLEKFMSQLGVPPGRWAARPAMVPCTCVVVEEEYREGFLAALGGLAIDGVGMKRGERPMGPMSYDERQRGFFQVFIQFDSYRGEAQATLGDRQIGLSEVGLGLMAHEDGVNCTAQHIPQGSLIVYRTGISPEEREARDTISTIDIAPSILKSFGFQVPSYMRGSYVRM